MIGVVQETLQGVLRDPARELTREEIESLSASSKLKGLNRRSFAHIVRKLCKGIGLSHTEGELQLVIASRNALIHQGRFYCAVATAAERRECEPLASKFEEYLHLLHFVDRLYLKLFGYVGKYIDWSVPGEPRDGQLA